MTEGSTLRIQRLSIRLPRASLKNARQIARQVGRELGKLDWPAGQSHQRLSLDVNGAPPGEAGGQIGRRAARAAEAALRRKMGVGRAG